MEIWIKLLTAPRIAASGFCFAAANNASARTK
jgi:hypothetical protein